MTCLPTLASTEPFDGIVHFRKPPPVLACAYTQRTGRPPAATAKMACSDDELGTGVVLTKRANAANTYPKTEHKLQTGSALNVPHFLPFRTP